MRVKSLPFEVKAVNAKERIIEGYAAVFGNVDSNAVCLQLGGA